MSDSKQTDSSFAAPWQFGRGIGVVAAGIGFVLASSALLAVFLPRRLDLWLTSAAAMNLGLVVFLYRRVLVETRERRVRISGSPRSLIRLFRQAALLFACAKLGSAVMIFAFWFADSSSQTGSIPSLSLSVTSLPTLVSDVVVGPIYEELTFRWILYRTLRKRAGVAVATTLSASAFALIHIGGSASSFLAIFWVGLVLAVGVERFRSLGPLILAHAAGNLFLWS